jgi:serine/threonine-protein kinase
MVAAKPPAGHGRTGGWQRHGGAVDLCHDAAQRVMNTSDSDAEPLPDDAPVEPLKTGAAFGPFEVVREVGRGAFGVVYEARRRPLLRRVALKVLHPHVLARPEALKRFERELAAAAAVEHPHVVAVLDGGVIEGRGYMAMGYLEGESLAARLGARGQLPVEEAVDAMLPVAAALEAVHRAGIVHRDVKPANVFLARAANGADHPVLLDFGVAKDLEDPAADLTRSQSWLGTPTYMSPEQIRQSKDVSARSDQWSFGVMLYECLVGARPFERDVLLDLMQAITTESPASPTARRPSVPEALSATVLRALAREPDARFPSMHALGEALLPFASEAARHWWRPHFSGAAPARPAKDLDATVVRDESARVPGRMPDPEGALPTLMANQPAISAPPVPAAKRASVPPKPSATTLSGQSADRERTVIVSAPPRSTSETLLRYVGVAAIAGFAFFAGRNVTAPPPAPAVVVTDASVAAVDAGPADVPGPTAGVARAPTPTRPRNGAIQILCGSGRATLGEDGRERVVSLPSPEPIPWPAGYVRVMIDSPAGQAQSYVTVRAGQTATFQSCPGM